MEPLLGEKGTKDRGVLLKQLNRSPASESQRDPYQGKGMTDFLQPDLEGGEGLGVEMKTDRKECWEELSEVCSRGHVCHGHI